MSKASHTEKNLQNERHGGGSFGPDPPSPMDCLEHVESSFNIPGVSIAMPQSSGDPECGKTINKNGPALPTKAKKLNVDRSDSRKYVNYVHKMFLVFIIFEDINCGFKWSDHTQLFFIHLLTRFFVHAYGHKYSF